MPHTLLRRVAKADLWAAFLHGALQCFLQGLKSLPAAALTPQGESKGDNGTFLFGNSSSQTLRSVLETTFTINVSAGSAVLSEEQDQQCLLLLSWLYTGCPKICSSSVLIKQSKGFGIIICCLTDYIVIDCFQSKGRNTEVATALQILSSL